MNLGYLLGRSADAYPDHPAVVYGTRVLTYQEWNARANRIARAFLDLGLQKGDRVAIFSPNRPEILETLFATSLPASPLRVSSSVWTEPEGPSSNTPCRSWITKNGMGKGNVR